MANTFFKARVAFFFINFTDREAHCAAIANVSHGNWYAALVMDDKKKTHEDVGIDVEVEERLVC